MPQFDVHRNLGASRGTVPYVVVVQSSLYDAYARRVVVPLVRAGSPGLQDAMRATRLNPLLRFEGELLVLQPLDMVSAALSQLGPKVGSVAEHGMAITDALDELMTRSWG